MSIQCLRRIIEQSKARGHSRLLLMVIAERADDAGFAYPGLDYLQHGTAMCHQAVVNNITALESRGELFVDRRRGGSNNRYLVLAGLSDYQISELLTGDKFQMSIEAAHAALESIRVAESIEQTQRQGNKSFGHTRAESGDQSRTESVEQTQIPESTGQTQEGERAESIREGSRVYAIDLLSLSDRLDPPLIQRDPPLDSIEIPKNGISMPPSGGGLANKSDTAVLESIPPTPPIRPDPKADKPVPKNPRAPTLNQRMFQAICDVWNYDPLHMTGSKKKEIGRVGSGLLEAGATPEDIAGLHQWCQDQKWPDFTANVYLTRWDDYKQADQSTTGSEEELDPANDPEFLARAKLVIIKTETTQQLMERAQQTRERLMGMKVASND